MNTKGKSFSTQSLGAGLASGETRLHGRWRGVVASQESNGLHRAHFAFMRAVLQGLDPVASWRRYLAVVDERVDLRMVRATLQWVRDEVAAAALRERKPGTARLVLIDARQLLRGEGPLPPLETFAAEAGLEEFSEAEQVAAYEHHFGNAATRQRRLQRLVSRQLDTLRWLESLASRPPALSDPVAMWLHPVLAQRLASTGIGTLERLVGHVHARGQHWYRSIRGIGATKAQRIVGWLRMQEVALGTAVGPHVEQPSTQWPASVRDAIVPVQFDVVPLEKLQVPEALSGRNGRFRAPRHDCLLEADDDLAALTQWLGPPPPASGTGTPARPYHTYRSYRKEAERLLLWALLERGKALSSLDEADEQAYLRFLLNPLPVDRWLGSPAHGRWSPLWRPFTRPLSTDSSRHAARVLRALFGFLAQQRYLVRPLFGALPPALEDQRSDRKQAQTFKTPADDTARLRVLLYTATRPSWSMRALCDARWCDVRVRPEDGHWTLSAPHGDTSTELPAPLVAALRRQLLRLALPALPGPPLHPRWHLVTASEHSPALRSRPTPPPGSGIQPGTLRDQLRTLLEPAASG